MIEAAEIAKAQRLALKENEPAKHEVFVDNLELEQCIISEIKNLNCQQFKKFDFC